MATRESMRRELKELAKLAETARKDRGPSPRSSGEWTYVPAEAADALDTESASSEVGEAAEASALQPRPSTVTVPPVSSVAAMPEALAALSAPDPRPREVRRAVWVVSASAVLATIVCAGVLGRSAVSSRGLSASAAKLMSQPAATVITAAPASPPSMGPDSPAETGSMASLPAPTKVLPAESSAPSARPQPSKGTSSAAVAGGGRPKVKPRTPPAGAALAKSGSSTAPSGGGDSLDVLIRNAVNGSPKQ